MELGILSMVEEHITTEDVWHCWKCGQALGVRHPDGHVEIAHAGRTISTGPDITQWCHRCHAINSNQPLDKPQGEAYNEGSRTGARRAVYSNRHFQPLA